METREQKIVENYKPTAIKTTMMHITDLKKTPVIEEFNNWFERQVVIRRDIIESGVAPDVYLRMVGQLEGLRIALSYFDDLEYFLTHPEERNEENGNRE